MQANEQKSRTSIGAALLAAVLFGVSTPLAKLLLVDVSPILLAGVLYAGSGIGLGLWLILRRWLGRAGAEAPLQRRDAIWLGGAVLAGGVPGPVLLMFGLTKTPASSASLLLNLEGALTAAIAWWVFRENVDRRVFAGMLAIVMGGALLAWNPSVASGIPWGALGIIGACLCWAIDNNLTRVVSGGDPVQIAAIKGIVAGTINIGLALMLGTRLPSIGLLSAASVVGFLGYGVSLVFFVLALRGLGTARTAAYFSTAPFVGAVLSFLLLYEVPNELFWIAAVLMASGVWLHISERHRHEHTHEPLTHNHQHRHDEHHQHDHDFPWDGTEPDAHPHVHAPLTHMHPHYPDLHHRHKH